MDNAKEEMPITRDKAKLTALLKILISTALLAFVLVQKPPEGLGQDSFHVIIVVIYLVTIWILQPMHYAITGVWGLTILVCLGVGTIPEIVTGFSSEAIFFLGSILLVSYAVHITGLDKNIALTMINLFKNSPSKIVLASPWFVLLMGLLIPSAIARATILKPIYQEICDSQLSCPHNRDNFRRATFLAIGPISPIVSATYLTGSAAPLLAADLIYRYTSYEINWLSWLVIVGVPLLLILVLSTVYISIRYPIRDEGQKVQIEKNPINITGKEKITLFIIVGMVLGWLFGGYFGIKPVIVSLLGSFMLFSPGLNILNVRNVRNISWELILFTGTVISLSHLLISTGGALWLGELIHFQISSLQLDYRVLLFVLSLVLLFLRLFFFNNLTYLAFVLPLVFTMAPLFGISPVVLSFISVFMSLIIIIPTQSITSVVAMGEQGYFIKKDIAHFGLAQAFFMTLVIPLAIILLWPLFGIK